MYKLFTSLFLVLAACADTWHEGDLSDMATPINPSALTTYPPSLSGPSAGGGVVSAQVNLEAQKLLDGVESARIGLYGGGMRRSVKCTGNGAGALTIQPLGSVVVTVAGVWTVYKDFSGDASERVTAGALNPTTLAGGALVASTRYWVYAFGSGNKIDFVASTTSPDSGLRYSSAPSTDYWFVSTFHVDVAGDVLHYTQNDLEYRYTQSITANRILTTGNATSTTNIAFNGSVDAKATGVWLKLNIAGSTAGQAVIYQPGDGVPFLAKNIYAATAAEQVEAAYPVLLLANGIDYVVNVSTVNLSIYIMGFTL